MLHALSTVWLFRIWGGDHELECVTHPFIIHTRNTLVELLETDGYSKEELLSLDPPNLLEMAYKELLKN